MIVTRGRNVPISISRSDPIPRSPFKAEPISTPGGYTIRGYPPPPPGQYRAVSRRSAAAAYVHAHAYSYRAHVEATTRGGWRMNFR